jgi:hypothetical protein
MASGLERHDEAVVMTRVMFPYIGFISLVSLSAGILNTWKRFALPAATPVLLNLGMIGGVWLLAPWLERHGIPASTRSPAASWSAASCSWPCRCRRWPDRPPAAHRRPPRRDAGGVAASRACI